MNLDKHVICRTSVTAAVMVVVFGGLWGVWNYWNVIVNLIPTITIPIEVLYNIGIGALWLLAFYPIVIINYWWYKGNTGEDKGIGIFTSFVCAAVLCAMAFGFPYAIPGIVLISNATFIALYYTVGKKACKWIYGGKE
jgi:hypothetical protein